MLLLLSASAALVNTDWRRSGCRAIAAILRGEWTAVKPQKWCNERTYSIDISIGDKGSSCQGFSAEIRRPGRQAELVQIG